MNFVDTFLKPYAQARVSNLYLHHLEIIWIPLCWSVFLLTQKV